jgi:hypothetical protein
MSYWTGGVRHKSTNLDMWKLSTALVKKHYNEVHLITDDVGKESLQDIPFTTVDTSLNNVPPFYKIWALGKIYAYQKAAQQGPFLHLDADVFLWKPLPKKLTNSNIFVQSPDFPIFNEFGDYHNQYDVSSLKKYSDVIPEPWIKHMNNLVDNFYAYNMGIFGGKDTKTILEYCDFVLQMVNDPRFTELWNIQTTVELAKSCLIEQGNLAIFAKEKNIKINVFMKDLQDSTNVTYQAYTHLMTGKDIPQMKEAIRTRVQSEPYNLEPNQCTIEEWKS